MPSSVIKVTVYRINNNTLISPLTMVLAGDLAIRPNFQDFNAASIISLRGDDYYVKEVVNNLYTSLNTSPAPYNPPATPVAVKVLPDANYTVLSTDKLLILTEPSAPRTLTLPAAYTTANQGQEINISCRTSTTGRWVLSGSFVQKTTTGTSPIAENFINSGFVSGVNYRLLSATHDNGTNWKWYDINN